MTRSNGLTHEGAVSHFVKRAQRYNTSSRWVDDSLLIQKIRDAANTGRQSYVLDIAIGTGKIARAFYGKVKYVVGIDICEEMARQAALSADQIVLAPAEKLPFKDGVFDACVCRQGLQFMDAEIVLSEARRTLKSGGLIVLCHLTAYGDEDQNEAFFIQRLRNPARKNFFLPEDIQCLLKKNDFIGVEPFEYVTRESVNEWIDNGAIDENQRRKIKEAYANSSELFRKLHNIEFKGGDILDSMKMVIVKARKRGEE